jgi:hypothetical protein
MLAAQAKDSLSQKTQIWLDEKLNNRDSVWFLSSRRKADLLDQIRADRAFYVSNPSIGNGPTSERYLEQRHRLLESAFRQEDTGPLAIHDEWALLDAKVDLWSKLRLLRTPLERIEDRETRWVIADLRGETYCRPCPPPIEPYVQSLGPLRPIQRRPSTLDDFTIRNDAAREAYAVGVPASRLVLEFEAPYCRVS